ncbi:MAG: hypothetical protein KAV87_02895 [Desulfobacteraceae bacterium]|nr:hypothetical protein [Desulfobacteraceae bacterium]
MENGDIVQREFSFDAFKFPACKSCNESYGILEENVKTIIIRILAEEALSELEFNTLLDWFDKVRIGLWLGYRYLNRNELGIMPHFHIEKRIAKHDRILLVLRANDKVQRLTFIGCDTPSFGLTPSCFSLRINNYGFLNMSYPNLVSRRIGFPYPSESLLMEEDERTHYIFVGGRERIMNPVLKKIFTTQGTELYQPIFAGNIDGIDTTVVNQLYETEYVRDNCLSWEGGIGRIFLKNNSILNRYSRESSKDWIPNRSYSIKDLHFNLQILTLDWQLYIESLMPSLKNISKEKKREYVRNHNLIQYYNKEIIQIFRKKYTQNEDYS